MNNKKWFSKSLIMLFALGMVSGGITAALTSSHTTNNIPMEKLSPLRAASPKRDSFNTDNYISIGRDELTVDLISANTTSTSKTVRIGFNVTRITGHAPQTSNIYVVIDDSDFSGSVTSPSLSGKTNPVFEGYTIEMADNPTFTLNYQGTKTPEFVVPEYLVRAESFSIKNSKILTGSFIFAEGDTSATFTNLIIPDGIETIESKAFQNIPDSVTIKCEAPSKPQGWADDWCDATNIEWGYDLLGEADTGRKTGNEEYYLSQNTGINSKFYGELVNTASDATGKIHTAVNDPNWTGNFASPVKTNRGLETPYHLNGDVRYVEVEGVTDSNLIIPESLVYSDELVIENKTIRAQAIVFPKNYDGPITNITIPSGVEVIEARAIVNLPNNVTITIETSDVPGSWSGTFAPGLTDNQLIKSAAIPDSYKTSNVADTDYQIRLPNTAQTYILGYKHTKVDRYYSFEDTQEIETDSGTAIQQGVYYTAEELVDGKSPMGTDVVLIKDSIPEYNLPLIVTYDIKNSISNEVEHITYEMPLVSEEETSTTTTYFDSVSASTLERQFDVLLEDNEVFVPESVKLYNIYRFKREYVMADVIKEVVDTDGSTHKELQSEMVSYIVPDTSVAFMADANKRYSKEIHIDEVVGYQFTGMSTFGDYTMISSRFDKVLPSFWFQGIDPAIAASQQTFLDSGEYSIRYCLYNLNNSYYRITYYSPDANAEVTKTIAVNTPNPVIVLEHESNSVSFLLLNSDVASDFKAENIRRFEIISLTVNIHLWNNKTASKVGRTDLSVHFGSVDLMTYHESAPTIFNIAVFIIIMGVVYALIYVGVAVALFFVFKNKYKNDEFRRMKPKQYVKTNVLGFIGGLIVTLTLLFIIMRWGPFYNSIAVHNPLDVFVVVPGIISIVVIGFFIKFLVVKIKTAKERRRALKLKLNEDVNDDGTK